MTEEKTKEIDIMIRKIGGDIKNCLKLFDCENEKKFSILRTYQIYLEIVAKELDDKISEVQARELNGFLKDIQYII